MSVILTKCFTTKDDLYIGKNVELKEDYHAEYIDLITDEDVDWFSQDKTNIFGGFNYLRERLLEINPHLKIIIVGHIDGRSAVLGDFGRNNGMIGRLTNKVQKLFATHYGFPFVDIASMTGWSKVEWMPNTSTFLTDYNSANGTSYFPYWSDKDGNISVFQFWCPDGVHPQSDRTGKTQPYLNQLFVKAFRDLI